MVLKGKAKAQWVTIYPDNQAAIRSLQCSSTTSSEAIKCGNFLNKLSAKYSPAIVWVPGRRDIPGNCKADELAREGTLLLTIKHAHDAGLPPFTAKYMLKLIFTREADTI